MMRTVIVTSVLLLGGLVFVVPQISATDCSNVIVGTCDDPSNCYSQTGVFLDGQFEAGYSQSGGRPLTTCNNQPPVFCFGAAGVGVIQYSPNQNPIVGAP